MTNTVCETTVKFTSALACTQLTILARETEMRNRVFRRCTRSNKLVEDGECAGGDIRPKLMCTHNFERIFERRLRDATLNSQLRVMRAYRRQSCVTTHSNHFLGTFLICATDLYANNVGKLDVSDHLSPQRLTLF